MGKRGPRPRRTEIIWSADVAYAVGLMATDGCLSKDGRHIELTSKDEEQLRNFMRCIGKQVRITKKKSGFTKELITRVQFSDVGLYKFFISLGLTPHKTHTLGNLLVPTGYFFDFLRGHCDGDGCFYSYFDPRWPTSYQFYLNFVSASLAHIEWLQSTIVNLCGAYGHVVHTRSSHRVYTLRYAKRESVILLKRMYSNSGVICLSRKRLKIEKALRIVGEPLSVDPLRRRQLPR